MKITKQIPTPSTAIQDSLVPMDESYLLAVNKERVGSQPSGSATFILDHLSIYLGDSENSNHYHFRIDKQFGIFLKGYFYLDISDSFDVEENIGLFFELLSKYGAEKSLSHIQGGLFNLYLMDRETGELHLHNDRLGLSPQFWIQDEQTLVFSDNQFNFKSVKQVSETALVEFLKFGYLPASPSLLKGVQRTPAFSSGICSISPFMLKWQTITLPYPSKIKREQMDKQTLSAQWSAAFARYFARLPKEEVGIGLSGGYDSRLLAAFAADSIAASIHFGHPSNNETQIAQSIARKLDLDLSVQAFPISVVAENGPWVSSKLQVLTSLENAHVMHLSKSIAKMKSRQYLDGFLGGAIMADAYFKTTSKNIVTKLKTMFFGDDFASDKASARKYTEALYNNDKQAISDEELGPLVTTEIKSNIMHVMDQLVATHWDQAEQHEDLYERLGLLTRGRFLIANGPSAISQHTQVLLPFMDNDVLGLSMRTPKKWRFSHGFYNNIWRLVFPALAAYRKAGTYGRPTDSDLFYRLKSIAFKLVNKLKALIPSNYQRMEEKYFSIKDYLENTETRNSLQKIMGSVPKHIPLNIHNHILKGVERGNIRAELILRYLTLSYALEHSHE